ncbi:LPD7 domain-containing protein [Kushneria indalinina]|uniref:LPD7 domain-containing protein n=1 Tax=Kushneria indalinina TaxID=184067 RepID=UPI001474D2D9|nr:LPD7 domain-containing protein [Kushneria indalinina]
MLARISGGKSGIGEYLREGMKSGRHYSRDDMDKREIIYGNLSLTESVIDSIADRGQERYLHVTLSFKEKEIDHDTLCKVTDTYVNNLMSAYKDDEYNYYAEVHRPKLQNIYNPSTDTMDERYPHIHIVIPKRNLVSDGRLNPIGRHQSNVDYFNSIQADINHRFGLESPDENKRDVLKGKTEAIARYGNELSGSKSNANQLKQKALEISKDQSYSSFIDSLKEVGEVRIRNAGRDTEHLAVKFEGQKQFTNLRESIFRKDFLDEGKLHFNEEQNNRVLDYWRNTRSLEIKYVADASKGVRSEYSNLENREKNSFLRQRANSFYQKHNYSEEHFNGRYPRRRNHSAGGAERSAGGAERSAGGAERSAGGAERSAGGAERSAGGAERPVRTDRRSSNNQRSRVSTRRTELPHHPRTDSLQKLQKSTLVQNQGRTLQLLHGHAHTHLHSQGRGADQDDGLRRALSGGRGGRGTGPGLGGINTTSSRFKQADSYISQLTQNATSNKPDNSVSINKLNNNISASRVLAYAVEQYNLDSKDFHSTRNKSGEPRIKTGNRNYSNSDFLTKRLNLSWPEAKNVLEKLHSDESENKTFRVRNLPEVKNHWKTFNEDYKKRNNEMKNSLKEFKTDLRLQRQNVLDRYYNNKRNIREQRLSKPEQAYKLALATRSKMTQMDSLKDYERDTIHSIRNSIRPFGKEEVHTMQNLEAYEKQKDTNSQDQRKKDKEFYSHKNSIRPIGIDYTGDNRSAGVENLKKNLENSFENSQKTSLKVGQLDIKKNKHGADFSYQGSTVFRDHGDYLSFGKNTKDQKLVDVTLSYAVNRYGKNLDINGSQDFKDKIVQSAADNNLDVSFSDSKMNEKLEQLREHQNEIRKAEMGSTPNESGVTAPANDSYGQKGQGATPRADAGATAATGATANAGTADTGATAATGATANAGTADTGATESTNTATENSLAEREKARARDLEGVRDVTEATMSGESYPSKHFGNDKLESMYSKEMFRHATAESADRFTHDKFMGLREEMLTNSAKARGQDLKHPSNDILADKNASAAYKDSLAQQVITADQNIAQAHTKAAKNGTEPQIDPADKQTYDKAMELMIDYEIATKPHAHETAPNKKDHDHGME